MFIITHNIVNEHYPALSTQVIIASIIYLIIFFILSDIFPSSKIKYIVVVVAIIDFIYFKKKYDSSNSPKPNIVIPESLKKENTIISNKKSEIMSDSSTDAATISLSELSDVRVSHDISTEENSLSILSESDY